MDINQVRAGTVLICPVKVSGGGVYVGDMHAFQGNGEIAGHTADVSGVVTLQVRVMKGLAIDGPILLPLEEDLPYLAKPVTNCERKQLQSLVSEWGLEKIEENAPVTFIGTGGNLNEAISNGLQRAANLLKMSVPEVMNRATIAGSIDIGRAPGVALVTFRCPTDKLEEAGLLSLIKRHYNIC